MTTDRLVDFVCVRETHQAQPTAPVVSIHSGALMLCPRGETLGHVWRAAAGAAFTDDRPSGRIARPSARSPRVPLRPN